MFQSHRAGLIPTLLKSGLLLLNLNLLVEVLTSHWVGPLELLKENGPYSLGVAGTNLRLMAPSMLPIHLEQEQPGLQRAWVKTAGLKGREEHAGRGVLPALLSMTRKSDLLVLFGDLMGTGTPQGQSHATQLWQAKGRGMGIKESARTCLVVQWLRLCNRNAWLPCQDPWSGN